MRLRPRGRHRCSNSAPAIAARCGEFVEADGLPATWSRLVEVRCARLEIDGAGGPLDSRHEVDSTANFLRIVTGRQAVLRALSPRDGFSPMAPWGSIFSGLASHPASGWIGAERVVAR